MGLGLLGCLCYGVSDWLMLYGEMAPLGSVKWLTKGIPMIPMWRFTVAMALAFPGIVLCGIALFSLTNVLFILMILKGITFLLPNQPYKIAFINGLMSESLFIWFLLMVFLGMINKQKNK